MTRSIRRAAIAPALGALLFAAPPAHADPQNLNRDLPLSFEDATPIEQGKTDAQVSARWESAENGDDLLTIEPQVQFGVAKDMQLGVSVPLIAGEGDRSGSGDLETELIWNFMKGDESTPSLALLAGVILPTGHSNDGLDTRLGLLLSKGIKGGTSADNESGEHRVHLNVIWDHNSAERSDERRDRLSAAFGYSWHYDEDTALLADLVRTYERQEGQESTVLEFGVLRAINDKLDGAAGIGFGLGDESPDVQLTLGVQYSF
jgi:hypothetical protein